VSVRHFLDIDGAATLPTGQLALVDQAVADLVATRAMGAVHGPAGLGKTFAVEQALARRGDRASACWVSFPSRPTMRLVAATLFAELCGTPPGRRDRFQLSAELLELWPITVAATGGSAWCDQGAARAGLNLPVASFRNRSVADLQGRPGVGS
jgi:hypothetical protein